MRRDIDEVAQRTYLRNGNLRLFALCGLPILGLLRQLRRNQPGKCAGGQPPRKHHVAHLGHQQGLLALPGKGAPVLTRELLYTGLTRAKGRFTLLAPNLDVLAETVRRQVRRSGGLAGG